MGWGHYCHRYHCRGFIQSDSAVFVVVVVVAVAAAVAWQSQTAS